MTHTNLKAEHRFTSSWRWTASFESWVTRLVDGYSVNVCAGLCPLGDVRVDMMSPLEIIRLMQDDENTSLADARDVLGELLDDQFLGRDVVQELYSAEDPTSHELAKHIDTDGCIRADVFGDDALPFDDDTFDWTIADPPWKELPVTAKTHLFDELVRITKPDGHILFNAWWIPTSDSVTLDHIRFRQDNDRYNMGTPNISYVSIYTVHSSPHTARYLSQTFTQREFAPEPSSLRETIEAETAYRLERVEGVPHEAYDIRAVGPDTSKRCPHCGCTSLSPATSEAGLIVAPDERLYQCPACEYPVPEHELDEIAAGNIQQVRYEHGWSEISQRELSATDPSNPSEHLLGQLEAEPGICEGRADAYLEFATGDEPVEGGMVPPESPRQSVRAD